MSHSVHKVTDRQPEVPKVIAGAPPWMAEHARVYIETKGTLGHYIDVTAYGGQGPIPTLLLKTVGRRTGRTIVTPLIYGRVGNEVAVIGSRGGEPTDPAWFLNLRSRIDADFQIGETCYLGSYRMAEGDERDLVWRFMVNVFAPFAHYQSKTSRRIPVILLNPTKVIAEL